MVLVMIVGYDGVERVGVAVESVSVNKTCYVSRMKEACIG